MQRDARLRTPFTQLGLTAEAASSVNFVQRMGWSNAAHVLMTSPWVSAEEAKEMASRVSAVHPSCTGVVPFVPVRSSQAC